MCSKPQLRFLLYSHDTVGLGHIRRNQAIACGLARSLVKPAILMASGARQSTLFDIPKCVDFVTIPALQKSANGDYKARNSGLSVADALEMRSELLRSLIQSFRPDVFVADKVPFGVYGELEPALQVLREQPSVRCVLGLRDILDEPVAANKDWRTHGYDRAIRDYYDAVWVYGDRRIYDVGKEYNLPSTVTDKFTYAGYLDRSNLCHRSDWDASADACGEELRRLTSKRIALCMVGGGEDGAHVATTFANSVFPTDMVGVILTGPFMPVPLREHLHSLAESNRQLIVLDFVNRPEWLICQANRIVAMGGYNTTCEILAYEKPGLIIPRVAPRQEQLVRAERLRDMGLIEMLHPDQLSCDALSSWLRKDVAAPHRVRESIDLGGLGRLPSLVDELVDLSRKQTAHIGKRVRSVPCCVRSLTTVSEARL